jgi:DNA-binding response OmpR family regulator
MSKKKIFYVEDDETLAFLTSDNLEETYEIHHFSNGKTAMENFDNYQFDLCILDVMLPQMDGFEITAEIRKRNSEIPIIFLSAKTLKEDRIKGLKLGGDDYLVKPYSIEELKLKIEIFLNRSSKTVTKQITEYEFDGFLFEPNNFTIKTPKESVKLTEREAGLLKLFLDNKNTVMRREDILIKLWGSDDYFLGRSLDVFISRLRKIFRENPNIKIENIPRIGFKFILE